MKKNSKTTKITSPVPTAFTKKGSDKKVTCGICPKACTLRPGDSGSCRIRKNIDGELILTTYGYPCSIHIDPIEKKPLFHFYPGSKAFSVATVGCNLHCKNCQNWEISQSPPDKVPAYNVPPDKLIKLALQNKSKSIAYTYTDPVVFYEYAYDCSVKAHEKNIQNILVTAGYIKKEPFKKLCRHVDAANIDLKAFSDKFYRDVCDATLKPVLDALVTAKNCGVIVEITNLVVPTLNDNDKDLKNLCKWVKENMGAESPLHFSRFFPRYRMRNLPSTPEATLKKARDIALSEGLKHVYVGNIISGTWENTNCPACGKLLIKRKGYFIQENNVKNGKCRFCNKEIYGKWN